MSNETEPVRWGILSTAAIGMDHVIPAIQASATCRVEAIASRTAESAAAAADRAGIPRWHDTYEAMLADDSIEAVYIPLPNHMHKEWAIRAMEAGKHVLCEKPLALTAADAREMIEVSDRTGSLLMEAFMYRLHPSWIEAARLVRSGAIGDLVAVDVVFSYFNDDPSNIRNIVEAGGGALYDIGCYAINVGRLLFGGEPDRIDASIRRDPSTGVDVVTAAILRFGEGMTTFVCSTRMEDDQRVVAYGSEGRLVVEIPFNIPGDLPTRVTVYSGGNPPVDPDATVHEFAPANPYTAEAEAFAAAVRSGGPVPIDPVDAVANLEVIEAIFTAADR